MSDPEARPGNGHWLTNTPDEKTPRKGREHSLHLLLKEHIYEPGDIVEAQVGRFKADILRENLIIEIQTRGISGISQKISKILRDNPIRVVFPVHVEKYIVKLDENGELIHRRRSPKRGNIYLIFEELMHIPHLLLNPGFQLHVMMIVSEEVRIADGKGSWHRGGQSVLNRGLLEVRDNIFLTGKKDYINLIPTSLHSCFTSANLAEKLRIKKKLAGKMAYTLTRAKIATTTGKSGRFNTYSVNT